MTLSNGQKGRSVKSAKNRYLASGIWNPIIRKEKNPSFVYIPYVPSSMEVQQCMQLRQLTFRVRQHRQQREVPKLEQNCRQTRMPAPSKCQRRKTLSSGRCRREIEMRRESVSNGISFDKRD